MWFFYLSKIGKIAKSIKMIEINQQIDSSDGT